jgi:GAF domain-containing protein
MNAELPATADPPFSPDPVVRAALDAALQATGASAGWVLSVDGQTRRLQAVAVVGPIGTALLGMHVGLTAGTAGYVATSGNPLALSSAAGDPRLAEGFVALTGLQPHTVLCVPCVAVGPSDGVVGVLELVDKADGSFGFDDVDVATLLGGVAAAALQQQRAARPPQPDVLAARLQHLAQHHPARYAGVAAAVDALLGHA